jgi:hypothetical protein
MIKDYAISRSASAPMLQLYALSNVHSVFRLKSNFGLLNYHVQLLKSLV